MIPLLSIVDLQRRYLIQNANFTAQQLASIISICAQFGLAYVVISAMNLGVIGAGLSITITSLIRYYIMSHFVKQLNEDDEFSDLRYKTYARYAVPSMLSNLVQFVTLSYLASKKDHHLLLIYSGLFLGIGAGIQQALCSFMGYHFGNSDFTAAKMFFRVFLLVTAGLNFILLIGFATMYGLAQGSTKIPDFITPLAFMVFSLQVWQCVVEGAARSLGLMNEILVINVVCYSLMIFLPFPQIFVSILLGLSLKLILLALLLKFTDWKEKTQEIKDVISGDVGEISILE